MFIKETGIVQAFLKDPAFYIFQLAVCMKAKLKMESVMVLEDK